MFDGGIWQKEANELIFSLWKIEFKLRAPVHSGGNEILVKEQTNKIPDKAVPINYFFVRFGDTLD